MVRPFGGWSSRKLGKQLGEVDRIPPTAVELVDLRAAREAVSQYDGLGVRLTDAGEHHPLRAGSAHLAVSGGEPEVACQATASRRELLDVDADRPKESGVG